jgi:hypothetical protein
VGWGRIGLIQPWFFRSLLAVEDRYLVYLVELAHLVSFVQPKNQTNQIDQTSQIKPQPAEDRRPLHK